MFTLTDFWDILNYLKTGTSATLDNNLKVTSSADKTTANAFFDRVVDQVPFSTDDYNRLRSFFIDWYASFRTMISTHKFAGQLFNLPEEDIEEFIKSFGYEYPENLLTFRTKVAFFLDLVNLYKIKGSPEALLSVMEYHDIANCDILEYWVEKDPSTGNIIFVGKSNLRGTIDSSLIPDKIVSFNNMTENDPHWMQTEAEILALANQNKIALPSPSPYISVRGRMNLQEINLTICIIRRKAEDQLYIYQTAGTLTKDIPILALNVVISLLELYCAIIYTYSRILNS